MNSKEAATHASQCVNHLGPNRIEFSHSFEFWRKQTFSPWRCDLRVGFCISLLVFQFMRIVFLVMLVEVKSMYDLSFSILMLVRCPGTPCEGEAGIVYPDCAERS